MELFIIKKITVEAVVFFIVLIGGLLFFSRPLVYASAPEMEGRVVNELDTGVGEVRVWWTDPTKDDWNRNKWRIEQTDGEGNFRFSDWTYWSDWDEKFNFCSDRNYGDEISCLSAGGSWQNPRSSCSGAGDPTGTRIITIFHLEEAHLSRWLTSSLYGSSVPKNYSECDSGWMQCTWDGVTSPCVCPNRYLDTPSFAPDNCDSITYFNQAGFGCGPYWHRFEPEVPFLWLGKGQFVGEKPPDGAYNHSEIEYMEDGSAILVLLKNNDKILREVGTFRWMPDCLGDVPHIEGFEEFSDTDCGDMKIKWSYTGEADGFRVYKDGVEITSVCDEYVAGKLGSGERSCTTTCGGTTDFSLYDVVVYRTCGGEPYESSSDNPSNFNCRNFPPNLPNLFSPGDGSFVDRIDGLPLVWHHSDWGCFVVDPANSSDDHFIVSLGESLPLVDSDVKGRSVINAWSVSGLSWSTEYWWDVWACNCSEADEDKIDDVDGATCVKSNVSSFIPTPGSWWQSVGGDVHGNGGVSSSIPASCVGPSSCEPYLTLDLGGIGRHGVVSCGRGGSISLGSDVPFDPPCLNYICHYSQGTSDWNAETDYPGDLGSSMRYGYDYWDGHFRNIAKDTSYTGGSLPDLGSFVVYEASGDINMSGPLDGTVPISSSSQVVVLHSGGDIFVNNPVVVERGGFLMVVTGGGIAIGGGLGGDSTNPAVQGVFVADEIEFEAGISHLYAEGTFVGWNNITGLEGRDLGLLNATEPGVTVIFRPDFVLSAPEEVREAHFGKWRQVPG